MKKLFGKYAWLQLILSILLLFGGTLVIVFAFKDKQGGDTLETALNIIAAVILFLFGGFAILTSFIFERKSAVTYALIYGSASIALGVFLCLKEVVLLDYIVLLLSIFFIVIGAVELIKAVVMTVKVKPAVWVLVLAYAFSVIFIAGGVLAIIFRQDVKIVFCVISGVLLILLGIYELVGGIKELFNQVRNAPQKPAKEKKSKKDKKNEEPVNTEPVKEDNPDIIDQQPEPEIKELDYTSNQIEHQEINQIEQKEEQKETDD